MTTLTFTTEAGVLIRGSVRRNIEALAWQLGLDIETRESKSWLVSLYQFTVKGSDDEIERFRRGLQKYARQMEGRK